MPAKRKSSKLQRVHHPESKVPYQRKPDELSLEAWQKALRKQFVADKHFRFLYVEDTVHRQ